MPLFPALFFLISALLAPHISAAQSSAVEFRHLDSLQRVEVYVDGHFFTAYRYAGQGLKKPILYPLLTAEGTAITRGYPLDPRPGERIDHPHHMGLWFNHGDVNDLDFWNNSTARPAAQRDHYGHITHEACLSHAQGVLRVSQAWRRPDSTVLLSEVAEYAFSGGEGYRVIDHRSTLTARERVMFEDSKEGMFALRVRRELELPSEEEVVLLAPDLSPLPKRVSNEGVTGDYLNSEGQQGHEVWGQRARWVALSGVVEGEPITILMMSAPETPNFPPHWMARGYGLFAVNPLGSQVYTERKETLNLTLAAGEQVTFRHRVVIYSKTKPEVEALEAAFETFVSH
jgi:hypothetical protein